MRFAAAAAGCELGGRKRNSGKYLTGILGSASGVVAAFLGGDGVVQHRYDQLRVPLQPDDGELPQSNIQPLIIAAQNQIVVKYSFDGGGDL